jgi:long-chain acyl-CoA synthetase
MSRLDELLQKMRQYASLPAIDGDEPMRSYGDLLAGIDTWSTRLAHQGIGAGDVVALKADYSFDSIALLFAALKADAILALLPPGQDTSRHLRDCCAQWLCTMEADGEARWSKMDAAPDHPLLQSLRAQRQGGIVIFTSGSAGLPKAALQSTDRFLGKFLRPGRRMRTLAFLLFDHVAGMDTLLYTLANGGTLIITRRRDPAAIFALIERAQVQVLPASPSFLRLLCLSAGAQSHDLASLQIITYGSEPMDSGTLARLCSLFPGVRMEQKYGTTETGSPRSSSRDNNSLWLKLSDSRLETRVLEGVLWIRGEGTLLGYLNAPSPVDDAGWYCTGDQVEVDGEWIRFLGRSSEMINVGGEKVSPTEVEQVMLELPQVREVLVRGEKHALMGQIVTARVVLAPECDTRETIRLIRTHCGQRLPRYKVPVKIDVTTGSLAGERHKLLRNP